jgi:hypothetical protein
MDSLRTKPETQDVHVLYPHRLFAAALELGEGFGLHRECPQ